MHHHRIQPKLKFWLPAFLLQYRQLVGVGYFVGDWVGDFVGSWISDTFTVVEMTSSKSCRNLLEYESWLNKSLSHRTPSCRYFAKKYPSVSYEDSENFDVRQNFALWSHISYARNVSFTSQLLKTKKYYRKSLKCNIVLNKCLKENKGS